MRVGIVVALMAEARALCHVPQPGRILCNDENCLLAVSGMGALRASEASRALLQAGANALVSWGTAGGLDPKYRSGHLLVAQKIMTTTGESFLTDQGWRTRVLQALSGHVDCSDNNVLTSEQLLTTTADKRSLHAQSGAAAVDLESSAVASSALDAGVPFIALRSVADRARMTLPCHMLEQVDPYGRPHTRALFQALVRYPRELVSMLQLFMAFRAAQATLQLARRQLGSNLLGPEEEVATAP